MPERLHTEFSKYLIVGGVAFVVDLSILYGLTEFLSVHYLVSATVGFLAGLTINYALSISWVFKTRRLAAHGKSEFAIFALVGAAGLAINDSAIWLFTEVFALHYVLSKVVTTGIVLLWNFFVRKYLLFR